MKRLLDETTDDFTRALLVAGIEQRPPAGNKRKVLIALGAGSALGLFSSQALAWLGTSGGKLSLLGVALGMAGAVYAVGPWSEAEATRGLGSPPAASLSPAAVPPAAPSPAALSPAAVSPAAVSAAESASPREPSAPGALGAVPEEAAVRALPARARSKRDGVAPAASEPRPAAPAPGPPAVSAGRAADAPGETEARLESASLDAEVRLVDDMRWAARRNDREALARFVATYQASFPDGQLEEEVSAFAARLERATTP